MSTSLPEQSATQDLTADGPVVVGVDRSERSGDALALGDALAAAMERPVLIASVHPFGNLPELDGGSYQRLIRKMSARHFHDVRAGIPVAAGREMQQVAGSSAAAGLHDLADDADASLLVLGSSHRSALGRVLPGGTAERLLSGAPVPMAVAPAGYAGHEQTLRIIGCAFDGSPESRRALDWAAGLARSTRAQLRIIGVHEPMPFYSVSIDGVLPVGPLNEDLRRQRTDEFDHAVAALGDDVYALSELLDGDPAQVLADASDRVDLLVLGSRGYGPLHSVLVGSVALGLLHSSRSPVVVTPRGARRAQAGLSHLSSRAVPQS